MRKGIEQFIDELGGLIDRHKLENDLTVGEIAMAFEGVKFELMYDAMKEAEREEEKEP